MAKKIKRELDCLLSHEECGELGIKASEARHKARELKDEASALEKEAKMLEEQVSNKKAKREVECVDVKDFSRNEIRVERCDENKYWPEGSPVVEVRPMSGEERQTMIDTGDDSGEKVSASKPTAAKKSAKRASKPN
jgi:seryl-tRNA synthetase